MWTDTMLIFQDELGPDEHLLWSGRPKTGLILRSSDIFLIPFSLLWGGFAIFWEISVIATGAPFFFWLWGIPFVLIGLYITIGRFFIDAQQRQKTHYALTNKRIIIISGLFNRTVKSLSLRTLSDISLSEKRNGTGTITFGPTHPVAWMYAGMAWPGTSRYMSPAFELIDAVRLFQKIKHT